MKRFPSALLIMTVLLCTLVSAQERLPVPLGIDGTVYWAQDDSAVPAGTFISFNDTTSGYYLETVTGKGPFTGKYSVAITGYDGDTLIITARSASSVAQRSIILSGSLHGIDLYLDASSAGNATNQPPLFTSVPGTAATVGSAYSYTATASDPESAPITYAVVSAPSGFSISASSGAVSWTPSLGDAGARTIAISASDGQAVATQSFSVIVSLPANNNPYFTTSAPITANVGSSYSYQAGASDPDGDTLAFSLIEGPSGMQVSQSGLVSFTAQSSQQGSWTVRISVSDGRGGSAIQAYTLSISAASGSSAPSIISTPPTEATQGAMYAYYVDGYDPDGQQLTYALPDAPSGMNINPGSGLITWTPQSTGNYLVRVRVNDTTGRIAEQAFTISVQASANPNTAYSIRGFVYGERSSPAELGTKVVTLLVASGERRTTYTGNSVYPNAYAISIDAHPGDTLMINASNETHQASRTITLSSTDTSVDLILSPIPGLNTTSATGSSTLPAPLAGSEDGEPLQASLSFTRASSSVPITQISADLSGKIGTIITSAAIDESDGNPVLEKNVYAYIDAKSSAPLGAATITFSVEKSWLSEKNIDIFSLKLFAYSAEWLPLPTARIAEDDSAHYFEATSRLPARLAIAADTLLPAQGAGIRQTYAVRGAVYRPDGKEAERGTALTFTNLDTGAQLSILTGESGSSGSFSLVIEGALGEKISVRVGDSERASYSFTLGGSDGSLSLVYDKGRQSLVPITGAITARPSFTLPSLPSIVLGALIIASIGGLFGARLLIKRSKTKTHEPAEQKIVLQPPADTRKKPAKRLRAIQPRLTDILGFGKNRSASKNAVGPVGSEPAVRQPSYPARQTTTLAKTREPTIIETLAPDTKSAVENAEKPAAKYAAEKAIPPKLIEMPAQKPVPQRRAAQYIAPSTAQFFYAQDGAVYASVMDLYLGLDTMSEQVFGHHVTSSRNDFAAWVEGVFSDAEIASAMKACQSTHALKRVLGRHL